MFEDTSANMNNVRFNLIPPAVMSHTLASEYLSIVEECQPELCDSPLVKSLDFCLGQLAAL